MNLLLLLAAADTNSAASKMGQTIGPLVGVVVVLGLVGVFILSVVKAATKKSAGWIVMSVLSGLVALLLVVSSVFALAAQRTGAANSIIAKMRKKITTKDGAVSLTVPGNWVESPKLMPEAALGAMRGAAEQYVIVTETSKQDYTGTLEDIDTLLVSQMVEKMKSPIVSEVTLEPIGAYPARRHRLEAEIDHMTVVYYATNVETKDGFYQVLTWTLKSKDAEAAPELKKVTDSFEAKAGPPTEGT